MGLWGGRRGAFWLDDVELRSAGGVNLLRREGCPLRVTNEDGSVEYAEGKDFERWTDPKMGVVPWLGGYEVYHAVPPIVLTKGSKVHDGDRLKVSYYHTQTVYDGEVCCCLSHDDVFKYFEDSVKGVNKIFHPKKIFVSHDEIRLADQCELCKVAQADGRRRPGRPRPPLREADSRGRAGRRGRRLERHVRPVS